MKLGEWNTNLDLREEAVVPAKLQEVIDGFVGTVGRKTERRAIDGRLAAGNIGAAISHRSWPNWNTKTRKIQN